MRWVTRSRPKTDRIACPWLILRFIDPGGEIVYVPADDVLAYAKEFGIEDAAVRRIAAIVHGADIDGEIDATPQSAGLLAIAEGFRDMQADDQRSLALQLPLYDALYQWARRQPEGSGRI